MAVVAVALLNFPALALGLPEYGKMLNLVCKSLVQQFKPFINLCLLYSLTAAG